MSYLLLATAGGLGAVARFLVDGWFSARDTGRIPFGTVTVNVFGSLLLGLLVGYSLAHGDSQWRTIAGVGFCGGFTTFSTASVEVVRLWLDEPDGRQRFLAIGYAAVTLVASVAAAALGVWIGAA